MGSKAKDISEKRGRPAKQEHSEKRGRPSKKEK